MFHSWILVCVLRNHADLKLNELNEAALKLLKTENRMVCIPGFPHALEINENLENHKKSSMHGKIMEFEEI